MLFGKDSINHSEITNTAQKMKFTFKDFFSKCNQISNSPADLVTITEEILSGKLYFFMQCKYHQNLDIWGNILFAIIEYFNLQFENIFFLEKFALIAVTSRNRETFTSHDISIT